MLLPTTRARVRPRTTTTSSAATSTLSARQVSLLLHSSLGRRYPARLQRHLRGRGVVAAGTSDEQGQEQGHVQTWTRRCDASHVAVAEEQDEATAATAATAAAAAGGGGFTLQASLMARRRNCAPVRPWRCTPHWPPWPIDDRIQVPRTTTILRDHNFPPLPPNRLALLSTQAQMGRQVQQVRCKSSTAAQLQSSAAEQDDEDDDEEGRSSIQPPPQPEPQEPSIATTDHPQPQSQTASQPIQDTTPPALISSPSSPSSIPSIPLLPTTKAAPGETAPTASSTSTAESSSAAVEISTLPISGDPPTPPLPLSNDASQPSPPSISSESSSTPPSTPSESSSTPPSTPPSSSSTSPKDINPLEPWTWSPVVPKNTQLANVSDIALRYRFAQDAGNERAQSWTDNEDMFRKMKTVRNKLKVVPERNRSLLSNYLSKGLRIMAELASKMDPSTNPLHAKFRLVVASYLSSIALETFYLSLWVRKKSEDSVGPAILRLTEHNSSDSVVAIALHAQGLALTGQFDQALVAANTAMLQFLPTLRQYYLRGEFYDYNAIRRSPEFQELQKLLYAILRTGIRNVTIQAERGAPRIPRRRQMYDIKRKAAYAESQYVRDRRQGPEASQNDDCLAKRRELSRLLLSLLPHGHLLSLASSVFRKLYKTFDDLICALSFGDLRKAVHAALDLPDRESAVESLLAIGASLVRLGRLTDAAMVYFVALEEHNCRLPQRFARLLIREASFLEDHPLVKRITTSLLDGDATTRGESRSSAGRLKQESLLEKKTWRALGGYLAHMGFHQDLALLWRRFVEAYPEESGSPAMRDQHLIAFAHRTPTLGSFRQHLLQNWNVPSFATGGEPLPHSSRKQDMSEMAYQAVISALARFGDIQAAKMFLDHMATEPFGQTVQAYNALINVYRKAKDLPAALELWIEMKRKNIQPNEQTYTSIAVLFAQRGDLKAAQRILASQEAAGYPVSAKMMVFMMKRFTTSDEFPKAVEVFRSFAQRPELEPSIDAYNCMFEILVRRGAPYEAVATAVEEMRADGYQPNGKTYFMLISSACDSDRVSEAEHWFAELDSGYQEEKEARMQVLRKQRQAKRDAEPIRESLSSEEQRALSEEEAALEAADDDTVSAELSQRSSLDDIFRSRGVSPAHWTLLIHAHLRMGNAPAAKEYFDEMQRRGVRVTSRTWSSLIKAYVRSGSETNKRLARDIVMRQLDSEEERREEILSDADLAVSSRKELEKFHRLQGCGMLLSPLLMTASAQGNIREVNSILQEYTDKGIYVTVNVLTAAMRAHRVHGDVDSMLSLWDHIFDQVIANMSAEDPTRPVTQGRKDEDTIMASMRRWRKGQSLHPPLIQKIDGFHVRRNALCVPLGTIMSALEEDRRYDEIVAIWTVVRQHGFAFDPWNWNQLATVLAKADRLEDCLKILDKVLTEMPPPDPEKREAEMREAIARALMMSTNNNDTDDGGGGGGGGGGGRGRLAAQPQSRPDDQIRHPTSRGRERFAGLSGEARGDKRMGPMIDDLFAQLDRIMEPSSSQDTNTSAETESETADPAQSWKRVILKALDEQDAVERAGYLWRPHFKLRRVIAAELAKRIGMDPDALDDGGTRTHTILAEHPATKKFLEPYPKAKQAMAYHFEGMLRRIEFAEADAERAFSLDGGRMRKNGRAFGGEDMFGTSASIDGAMNEDGFRWGSFR